MSRRKAADAPESEAEKHARWRREVQAYEEAHDELVPGTVRHGGDRVGPEGGIHWNDQARMAKARRPEDRNDVDLEALRRYPEPTGWIGSEL